MSRVGKKLWFLEEVSRHKALFLLLLRSEDFVTSEELAGKLGVTSRTIKSDIKTISEHLQKEIPELWIDAKRSKGVRIVFADEELKKDTKEYFKIYQISTIDTELEKRVKYIAKRLLTAKEPVRVEQLQEELFLNTSNYIQEEMKAVRSLFDRYDLTSVSFSKSGMKLEGNLFNRLVCLLKICPFFDDAEQGEQGWFEVGFARKEEIKQVLCSCLAQTRIVFSDLSLEKVIRFFLLLYNSGVSEEDHALAMKEMDFDYRITEEYALMQHFEQHMQDTFRSYPGSNEVLLEFMTYMAVMNTDLYRIRDCTAEHYGSLVCMAEQIRDLILTEFERTFQVSMTSETVKKDLVKILIPISMKIKLQISDDLDVGLHEQKDNKPVMVQFVEKIADRLKQQWGYLCSVREKNLLLHVLYEFINEIELEHKKMKIALLAIDGRLSTQQLKFCLRKNIYASFVEKIDTKVLYELEKQEHLDYDYYFCSAYGKNMNIPYSPISFFEEGITEKAYEQQLDLIFVNAYDYGKLLPSVTYHRLEDRYKIELFPIEKVLHPNRTYLTAGETKAPGIAWYVCFDSEPESIDFYYFDDDGMDIHGISKYVIINVQTNGNEQKWKMILLFLSNLIEKAEELDRYCKEQIQDVSVFFRK